MFCINHPLLPVSCNCYALCESCMAVHRTGCQCYKREKQKCQNVIVKDMKSKLEEPLPQNVQEERRSTQDYSQELAKSEEKVKALLELVDMYQKDLLYSDEEKKILHNRLELTKISYEQSVENIRTEMNAMKEDYYNRIDQARAAIKELHNQAVNNINLPEVFVENINKAATQSETGLIEESVINVIRDAKGLDETRTDIAQKIAKNYSMINKAVKTKSNTKKLLAAKFARLSSGKSTVVRAEDL